MNYPSHVQEIWLFGSKARANNHSTSDTDILVVSDAREISDIFPILIQEFGNDLDVAHYTSKGIEKVILSSSLFALHLIQEGVQLYKTGDNLSRMLNNMPMYNSHIRDLDLLDDLLRDVHKSINSGTASLVFEFGVLATICRNTGIIVSHYLGVVDFSPLAPLKISMFDKNLALPMEKNVYIFLQNCRRAGERGISIEKDVLCKADVFLIYNIIESWHNKCRNYIQWKEEGML